MTVSDKSNQYQLGNKLLCSTEIIWPDIQRNTNSLVCWELSPIWWHKGCFILNKFMSIQTELVWWRRGWWVKINRSSARFQESHQFAYIWPDRWPIIPNVSRWRIANLTGSLTVGRLRNVKYGNPLVLICTLLLPTPAEMSSARPLSPTGRYWLYISLLSPTDQDESSFNHCGNYT